MEVGKASHARRLLPALWVLVLAIGVATVVAAETRLLQTPVPYDKGPDATNAPIPQSEVVVFLGQKRRQILTFATLGGNQPDFCPEPTLVSPAPKLCRGDFLIVRGDRVVALGRTLLSVPSMRDPRIRSALAELDVGPRDIGVVRLGAGELLMPGLVDAHTHIFNQPEAILDKDGRSVGSQIQPPNRQAALALAQQIAISNGITTAGNLFANQGDLDALRLFNRRRKLHVRLSLYLPFNDPGNQPVGGVHELIPDDISRPWNLGGRLRVEGVKIFVDGGAVGRRALSYERQFGIGNLWFPDEDGDGSNNQLNRIVRAIHCSGFQVAMHAAGDLAIPLAQTAIGRALESGCRGSGRRNVLRHRIEHHRIVTANFIRTNLQYGIPLAVGLWTWICDPHIPPQDFWAKHDNRRLLVDRGVNRGLHVAWHGDDPNFGQQFGMVAPFFELHNAVTRVEIPRSLRQGLDSGVCFAPRRLMHRVTVSEALPMMTIESAYLLHRENEVGSLARRKKADLIILSQDPQALEAMASGLDVRVLDRPIHEIRNIHVLMTMIGGHVEFCAEDREALCRHSN